MKRLRKKRHRKYTNDHITQLGIGANLLAPHKGWGPAGFHGPYSGVQLADMEKCWQLHGERLVAEYVRSRPTYRPWYWWKRQGLEPPKDQLAALRELNELTDGEKRWLETPGQ